MASIELTWLLDIDNEDESQQDLLASYFREVANGPMTDYRRILQSGHKQGQNYYVHVLDGIGIFHKLRIAKIVEISDLEERLLFAAYTIHDITKNPLYGGRDVKLSYTNITTSKNIRMELDRIDFLRFFPEWEEYLEDVRLLAHLHQHDTPPLFDLDQHNHNFKLRYERLLELGKLMYAADNLDLSHSLSENNFKENFLANINALSERRWRWVTHRLAENRALLSNLIHNTIVAYFKERHTYNNQTFIADMLYYPDGVAYLLPEREAFTWTSSDMEEIAQRTSNAIVTKKISNFDRFINSAPIGIKVADAAVEDGANYIEIMYAIRKIVDRRRYTEKKHNERNEKLRANLRKIANGSSPGNLAISLLNSSQPIVPLEQDLLKRGELISAYRNLLQDHLKKELKKKHNCDPWRHIYSLLTLPHEYYMTCNQISDYQRGYFIAGYCGTDLDTLFNRFLADIVVLTGAQQDPPKADSKDFYAYLSSNLELSGSAILCDFKVHLQRYVRDIHKQCCICSSPLSSVKLMDSDVPDSIGVQVFSNRLKGGGGEPKRNVCAVCRTQLILEKLANCIRPFISICILTHFSQHIT